MTDAETPSAPDAPTPHPARALVLAEAHARPALSIAGPGRIVRLAFMRRTPADAADRAFLDDLCDRLAVARPAPDARHHVLAGADAVVACELHAEFTTYTLVRPGASTETLGGDDPVLARLSAAPGLLLAATQVSVLASSGEAADIAAAQDLFGHDEVIATRVGGEAYLVATDCRADAAGVVRYLAFDRGAGTEPAHRGRVVQKLLDIETYRLAALLGFALARETAAERAEVQREADELSARLAASPHVGRDRELLNRISSIAGRLELLRARTRYRFAATRAYDRIVLERIERLREERLQGRQRIGVFMELRLAPAMRTVEAAAAQQDELSAQLARATQLLATRVNVAVQEQNSRLLGSMDDRARLQLRLQETVEGLSVIAISYYAVGLVYYGARGLAALGAGVDAALAAGVATPVVLALAWLGVRRLRKRLAG